MLNTQTSAPKQVLLRLPDDLALKLAKSVPTRQRNQYLVNLLRQELAKEDAELVAACEAMNHWEAAHPEIQNQTQQWVDAALTQEEDGFDKTVFEREFAIAQAQMHKSRSKHKTTR